MAHEDRVLIWDEEKVPETDSDDGDDAHSGAVWEVGGEAIIHTLVNVRSKTVRLKVDRWALSPDGTFWESSRRESEVERPGPQAEAQNKKGDGGLLGQSGG